MLIVRNLENEEYLNALANESYAIIFTQSTTNTVAQKKVKKAFEAGGCHIGAKDKHVSWKAGNGDFQTVDAFLESDNSAGTVRDQLREKGGTPRRTIGCAMHGAMCVQSIHQEDRTASPPVIYKPGSRCKIDTSREV